MRNETRRFPLRIRAVLAKHHRKSAPPNICGQCASTCCNRSGFAVLENVCLIYDLYVKGKLKRDDYRFEKGLHFESFVQSYFDVLQRPIGRSRKKDLLTFHPKCIDGQGRLISIPDMGDFWETREALFTANPWLSHGCVFLSRKAPLDAARIDWGERHCILHRKDSLTHLSAKPIDCVFHTCASQYEFKAPTSAVIDEWFLALASSFPRSANRFTRLLG